MREGSAVHDSLFPDRIVVGGESREALDAPRALYGPIVEQSFPTEMGPRPKASVPFVTTDLASAETIKYAANAFLAAKIGFVNGISNLCELSGADVAGVATGIGLDDRIGWGGSCFPKDVAALRSVAREYGYEPVLPDAAVAVNRRQRGEVIHKLRRELHSFGGRRIALIGPSFEPDTDDLRGAPSLEIAESLVSLGARVVGHDPVAGKAAARLLPAGAEVVFDPCEASAGAHAAVMVTGWDEVRGVDTRKAASLMEPPGLLVDGRNAIDPRAVRAGGLLYSGFGRGG